MRRVLYLTASPRDDASCSRLLAEELIAALRDRAPGVMLDRHDLVAEPPPLVDAGFSAAILSNDPQAPALAASEALIARLEAADTVVIATAMHNYGVPAVLKAWVDQVVRIHRTFRSTPAGKVGLLADRPVFLVVASGGWFTGPSPTGAPAQPDFLTPYLRAILATIGIQDLRCLALEGVTRGPEAQAAALARARSAMAGLLG